MNPANGEWAATQKSLWLCHAMGAATAVRAEVVC
jgi:hypothetical protein